MRCLVFLPFVLLCGCGFGVTLSLGYKDVTVGIKVEPPAKKTAITVPLNPAK